MKRPIAAVAMVGILLAASTAAFATPVAWTSTVNVNITRTYSEIGTPISWFQPYNPVDPVNYPGSSINDTILTGGSYGPTLTIVANNVRNGDGLSAPYNVGETDKVYRGTSSSGTYLGNLTQGAYSANTITTFTLSNPNAWLKGTNGFDVFVDLDNTSGYWYPTTIRTAALTVWTEWNEPEPPPPPPEPPVVPAPGAMLLASLGAGVVSLLRTRKAL